MLARAGWRPLMGPGPGILRPLIETELAWVACAEHGVVGAGCVLCDGAWTCSMAWPCAWGASRLRVCQHPQGGA